MLREGHHGQGASVTTAWEDRLTSVVFPAQLAGLHLYTALGELLPGTGLPQTDRGVEANEAAIRKPVGLPKWQVYLGAKATQPAIRFLQLVHRVHNPVGSAALVYPTRLRNDHDRGVALIVPLGEGLDTPPHELAIARDLQNQFFHRPVRVIALGRYRAFTTTSSWTLSEHLLMEVYSEAGELLWVNPFIGLALDEAIDRLLRREPLPSMAAASEARTHAVPIKRQEAEAEIRQLIHQGRAAEEIKDQLVQARGFDPKVADRLLRDFSKREAASGRALELIRHFAEQLEDYYEGDEFLEAVAEDSGQSLDLVRQVLGGTHEQGRGPHQSGAH